MPNKLNPRYPVTRLFIFLFVLSGISNSIVCPFPSYVDATSISSDTNFPRVHPNTSSAETGKTRGQLKTALPKLPLRFEANRGQTAQEVKFLARGNGYDVFLTATEMVLSFQKAVTQDYAAKEGREIVAGTSEKRQKSQSTAVRMKMLGANRNPRIIGTNRQSGNINYFRGSDPKKWLTHVPSYSRVRYNEVYPGIGLTYFERDGQLEYDFTVSPGIDPNKIRLGFDGAIRIEIDVRGDLILHTSDGQIRHRKPFVYQEVNASKRQVKGEYVLTNKKEVLFRLGDYDRTKPLVIDPAIAYSTILGGTIGGSHGVGIAVQTDPTTGIVYTYIVGTSNSSDFPTKNGLQFPTTSGLVVAKLNTATSGDDSLVYSTYIQGTMYDGTEKAIAVGSDGSAYVVGASDATDFPIVNAFQPVNKSPRYHVGDACIAKITPNGSGLVYSSYLGGSGSERATGVAVDLGGNAYIVGTTSSADFPTVSAAQSTHQGPAFFYGNANQFFYRGDDVFVAKITPPLGVSSASLTFATYVGGTGEDRPRGIAVDPVGNVYVTGSTDSTNFPTINGFQMTKQNTGQAAFVSKLNPSVSGMSSFSYSTYLSGSGNASSFGIALDEGNNAYVTGSTFSTDFPTTQGAYKTTSLSTGGTFVSKIDPSKTGSSSLVYSTYVYGDVDFGTASNRIAVDADGTAYITGLIRWPDFPTVNPIQSSKNGIFQSVNSGGTWTLANRGMTSFSITDIVIDTSTVPRTLYAGSDTVGFNSGGVFKSIDGGSNWTPINVGLTNRSVRSLVMNPANPTTLYASTSNGIFKSSNGGNSWAAINDGILDPSIPDFTWHNLVLDTKTSPAILYTWTNSGVYKIAANANEWTPLSATLTNVFSLAIDTKASPASLYALTYSGVYRSRSGGSSWDLVLGPDDPNSPGHILLSFAIDPRTTPSTLYGYDPDITETRNETCIMKSTDDGSTWQAFCGGPAEDASAVRALLVLDTQSQGTTLYVSTLWELKKSTDDGASWIHLLSHSGKITAIAIDPSSTTTNTPSTLYVGTGNDTDTDAYVAKLDPTGSQLLFSSYIGGIGSDYGEGVALDSTGNIYLVGTTASANFPTLNAYNNPNFNDLRDRAFIVKIGSASLPQTSAVNVTTQVGVQDGTLALTFPNITGSTDGATPTVTVDPIDAQTAASLILSNNLGAYEIETTATFNTSGYETDPTKGIKIAFTVPTVNDPAVFNNIVITHGEDSNGDTIIQPVEMVPYNGTVDPNKITYRDFASRTVWVYVSSFSPFVIVKGAADQFSDMVRLVKSYNLKAGIENSLDGKLQNALKAYQAAVAKDKVTACSYMVAFNNEVLAQTGKALTQAQSNQLVSASNQIKVVLGCH